MLSKLSSYQIILASNSPRRRELLAGLGIDFKVRTISGIDESYPESLKGEEIPVFIAEKKAEAYLKSMADDEMIITADTIVYLNRPDGTGEVLGKPHDAQEAFRMLRELSGRHHEVITGVSVVTKEKQVKFAVTSKVISTTINLSTRRVHMAFRSGSVSSGSTDLKALISMSWGCRCNGSMRC